MAQCLSKASFLSMGRSRGLLIILLSALSFCGCSSSSLTREKAKDVIEHSANYKPQSLGLNLKWNEADELIKEGYLDWKNDLLYGNKTSYYALVISAKGSKYFARCDGYAEMIRAGVVSTSIRTPFVLLATPVRPAVVAVTGLADGPDKTKIVEYQWNWDLSDLPSEIRNVISKESNVRSGKGTLRLFDDGWRVDKLE